MGLTQILVVAAEASGDQHASELVRALKERRPDLRFFGMGGERLKAAGLEAIYDAAEISVMGISEVLPKIPRIFQVMRGLKRAVQRRRPACAILVDAPDFNLRLAGALKALAIPVIYYISPMVWAWRRRRTRQIADRVDQMLCILPFEEPFLRRAGVQARYVGSPVLEQLPDAQSPEHHRRELGLAIDRPTIAFLPGSRKMEITRILPVLVATAQRLTAKRPNLQIVLPVAPGVPKAEVASAFTGSGLSPILIEGRAAEAVGASDVAVVASGTATLEAGLMLRPLVVVYRVSPLTYGIGRMLVDLSHVSLVNLLAGQSLVPELLQGRMTAEKIEQALEPLWDGGPARDRMVEGLIKVRAKLGTRRAAAGAASAVIELLDSRS